MRKTEKVDHGAERMDVDSGNGQPEKCLISLDEFPIRNVLGSLLADKSTGRNILFATDAYTAGGNPVDPRSEMTEAVLARLDGDGIRPRVRKDREEQAERTRSRAEVFTPAWICNKMASHCDAEWFGREDVFNREDGQDWIVTEGPIRFPEGKSWKDYVDSRRLEITCGEAPYLVSRYDAATGEPIPIDRRIGILDRKLRIVGENTGTEKDWLQWAVRAFQSVYGYEFQGDSLLIARVNLLLTFAENLGERWRREPTAAELRKFANIISWNLWQMDGLTNAVPYGKPAVEYQQMTFFDYEVSAGSGERTFVETPEGGACADCRIYDWRSRKPIPYRNIQEMER